MLSEPVSITIDGTARSLARVGSGENTGSFKDDGLSNLAISHTYGKRVRHVIRFTDTKTTADPLQTGSAFLTSLGVNLTIDSAPVGYTAAETKKVVDGVLAALTASSGAMLAKIIGGES